MRPAAPNFFTRLVSLLFSVYVIKCLSSTQVRPSISHTDETTAVSIVSTLGQNLSTDDNIQNSSETTHAGSVAETATMGTSDMVTLDTDLVTVEPFTNQGQYGTVHDSSTTETTNAVPGTCSPPVTSSDLNMTSPSQTVYPVNSTVSWECLNSDLCYSITGDSSQICLENGTWSGVSPSCQYLNTYQCPDVTEDLLKKTSIEVYISNPLGQSDNVTACGTTLSVQCSPGYEIRQNVTKMSATCHKLMGWTRHAQYTVCRGSNQCLCTNDSSVALDEDRRVYSDSCHEMCAGRDDEYCGGSIMDSTLPMLGDANSTVLGAAYYTIGGCYVGLDALSASNITTGDERMTPVNCRQFCELNEAQYAVLHDISCTCLEEYHLQELWQQPLVTLGAACNTICIEDRSKRCGGKNAVSVFNLDPDLNYGTARSCYELFLMGVRAHGVYQLKDGDELCYMSDNTTCSEGWLGFQGQCYLFLTDSGDSTTDAVSRCGAEGGYLMSIRSQDELDFFEDTLTTFSPYNLTTPWLIGMHDPDQSNRFTWADGTPVFITKFAPKDPKTPASGSCVYVFSFLQGWTWEVRRCTHRHKGFVCEKPSEERQTDLGTCVRSAFPVMSPDVRWLSPMTVSLCRQLCRAEKEGDSLHALVNFQTCFCATNETLMVKDFTSAEGDCQNSCPGNHFQMCGSFDDPLVYNVYPPLMDHELAQSCDDLYFSGVNFSSVYQLRDKNEKLFMEFCNFTQHVMMCPTSWFYVNGTCLRPVPGFAFDIQEAMSICDLQGGFLTTRIPESWETPLFGILNDVAIFDLNMPFYRVGQVAPLRSQMYRSVDGSLLPEIQFAPGQPDDALKQCVIVKDDNPQWLSVFCNQYYGFICQRDIAFKGNSSGLQSNTNLTGQFLVPKLTCLNTSILENFNGAMVLNFTYVDMTLTVCLERCRGEAAVWAAVYYNVCRCYNDNEPGIWQELAKVDHKVLCGKPCPSNQFQYCGGDVHAVVLVIDMYPTLAQNCTHLYFEGVRMEGTYRIQFHPEKPPVYTTCFFVNSSSLDTVPQGFISYQHNLYYFQPGNTTLQEAQEFCWQQGGSYLLSVTSTEEYAFLKTTIGGLASYRDRTWLIGYTDNGQNNVAGWIAPDLFLSEPGDTFSCDGQSPCCVQLNVTNKKLQLEYISCSQPDGTICKRPGARQACIDSKLLSALYDPVISNEPDMSALLCSQACRGASSGINVTWAYAIEGQDCYCQHDFGQLHSGLMVDQYRVDYSECATPCAGHAGQYCGNGQTGRALVYEGSKVPDSEKASSCAQVLDNGLYVNVTYLLNNSLSGDFFMNCYHECSRLTVAPSSLLESEDRTYRSNVTVMCPMGMRFDSGFRNAYAVCTSSGWERSEQNFACTDVTCAEFTVAHGTLDTSVRTFQTSVNVTCDPGFEADGGLNSYTVVCSEAGEWEPLPTDCQRKSCASPTGLDGVQGTSPGDVMFGFTTVLTLVCQEGWTTQEGATIQFITCNSSSMWEPSPLPCSEPAGCSVSAALNWNTTWVGSPYALSTNASVFAGHAVEFGCYTGYDMSDGSTTKTAVCTDNGDFHPPLENCTWVCDTTVFRFAHIVVRPVEDRKVATIFCDQGYQLPNKAVSGEIECVDGYWRNVTECQLPDCGPISLNNSNVLMSSTSGVSTATVTCLDFSTFVDGSTEKAYMCLQGSWFPNVEDCIVRCPNLTVGSATVEVNVDRNGREEANIRCYSGYHFLDDTTEKTVSCTALGTWSEPQIEDCVLSSCDVTRLTTLSYASVSNIQTVDGVVLKNVTCHDGYQFPDLTTSRVYGCDGGGLWYPSLDNCSAIECDTLHGQTNAAIQSENRTFQATVSLVCAIGWRFSDKHATAVLVCQANKTWSPSPQYCFLVRPQRSTKLLEIHHHTVQKQCNILWIVASLSDELCRWK